MRKYLTIWLLIVTLPVAGQKWEKLDVKFNRLHMDREYTEAAKVAVKEVTYSLKRLDSTDIRYMRSYYNLALAYYNLEQLDQAKSYLWRAYWLMAPYYTLHGEDFANVCDLYGQIETRHGYHDKAAEFLTYARESKAILYGKNSYDYVSVLYHLAELEMARADWEQMVIVLEEALVIHEQHFEKNPDFARYTNFLGLIYMNNGNNSEAVKHFQRALSTFENSGTEKDFTFGHASNNLALAYYYQSDFQNSAVHFEKADSIYQVLLEGYSENYMMLLNNLASLYYSWGKPELAREAYQQLEAYMERYPDPLDLNYIQGVENTANYYAEMGVPKSAEKYYLKAIELRRITNPVDSAELAGAIYLLAYLYREGGRPDLAAETAMEAYNILVRVHSQDNPELLYVLDFLGESYFDANQDQRSLYYYELARNQIELMDSVENSQKLSILNNLGLLYYRQGRLVEALQYLEMAHGLNPQEPGIMINLGMVYYDLGNVEGARQMYAAAKESYGEVFGANSPDYANALIHEIGLMARFGDFGEEMLSEIREVERICIESKVDSTSRLFIDCMGSYRTYYFGNKEYHRSIAFGESVLGLVETSYGRNSKFYAENLMVLADSYVMLEDEEKLSILFNEAFNIASALDSVDRENLCYFIESARSVGYYLLGDFETSRTSLEWVIERDKEQFVTMQNILSARERANLTGILDNLTLYNYYLLKYPDDPDVISNALNNRLFLKGLLMDSEKRQRNALTESGDTTIVGMYDEYRQKKIMLANLRSEFGVDQEILNSMESNLAQLETAISRKVGMEMDRVSRSVTWKDIQQVLGADEAAVEIVQFNYQPAIADDTVHIGYWYAGFVITRETVEHPQCILIPMLEMEGGEYVDYKSFMESSAQGKLSDQLWMALDHAISGKKTIYFSPDGAYHKLNLESFTDQTGNLAIYTYRFQYMNSLLELLVPGMDYSKNRRALLAGDPTFRMSLSSFPDPVPNESSRTVSEFQSRMFPGTYLTELPGTRTEVDSIGSMFASMGWNCTTLTGEQAIEEAITEVSNPRVLHLATHGYFAGDNEQADSVAENGRKIVYDAFDIETYSKSCLFLSGAQSTLFYAYDYQEGSGDGILTAGEIIEMKLDSTELVVLSACDTGLGDVLETGGIYGLRRAFHLAGARRVMISLWKVDDQATQLLMREFYSNWITGKDMDESLIQAKQYLIHETEFSHPRYWAAFILSGI